MNLIVDLQCDLGEGSGYDEELFELISRQMSRPDFTPAILIRCTPQLQPRRSMESLSERIQVFSIAKISDVKNWR